MDRPRRDVAQWRRASRDSAGALELLADRLGGLAERDAEGIDTRYRGDAMAKQTYKVRWTPDGAAHVEALHKTAPWLHGVMGPRGHEKWARSVAGAEIEESEGKCRCGLQLGQFRKKSGQTHLDPGFGDKPKGPRAAKPAPEGEQPGPEPAKRKPAKERPAKAEGAAKKPDKKPDKGKPTKRAAKAKPAKRKPTKRAAKAKRKPDKGAAKGGGDKLGSLIDAVRPE